MGSSPVHSISSDKFVVALYLTALYILGTGGEPCEWQLEIFGAMFLSSDQIEMRL